MSMHMYNTTLCIGQFWLLTTGTCTCIKTMIIFNQRLIHLIMNLIFHSLSLLVYSQYILPIRISWQLFAILSFTAEVILYYLATHCMLAHNEARQTAMVNMYNTAIQYLPTNRTSMHADNCLPESVCKFPPCLLELGEGGMKCFKFIDNKG